MTEEFDFTQEYNRYEDLYMGKYTAPDGRVWYEQPRVFGRLTYACGDYFAIFDHSRHSGVKLTRGDGTVLGFFPTVAEAHYSVFPKPYTSNAEG